jgi:hypothetical protein
MIKITHDYGFFSCCSVKLTAIVEYINSHKRLPDNVDSSQQFTKYKQNNDINTDITYDYFEHYDDIKNVEISVPIKYHWEHQFLNYTNLDYTHTAPLIKKYFSPSVKINDIVDKIEKKYNFMYDNTLAVYYRGTDKKQETQLASFDDFYKQITEIIHVNKNINILIQTDTAQFLDYMNSKNLKNIMVINENETSYTDKGIHNELTNDNNYSHMLNFLSTVLIISKCKYIICSSGNCSIWMMFYRGNNKNVIQYLNGTWLINMP